MYNISIYRAKLYTTIHNNHHRTCVEQPAGFYKTNALRLVVHRWFWTRCDRNRIL